jgi:signal transduction histidine kinase
MQLSMTKNNPEKATEYIATATKYLQNAIEENRKIAHSLVAPDFRTKTLVEQIFNLTETMLIAAGIQVTVDAGHFQEDVLNDQQKLAIYRIAQEQCNNITKYAKAKKVKVSLRSGNGLFKMVIADNGQGVESVQQTKGIGLRNIDSRLNALNGKAAISTAPGKGFTLEIEIPVD